MALGPPFLECPSCKGFVNHEPFEEWSSMGARKRFTWVGTSLAVAVSLGILPLLACGLADIISRERTSPRTLLFIGGTGLFVALAITYANLHQRIRRSRRRMSDPMYRAKLVKYQMSATGSPLGS